MSMSSRSAGALDTRSASRDIAKALALVGALMLWNLTSDAISARLDTDGESVRSLSRLGRIALGALVTCGGVVGLGCVLWGRRSLRELGWTGRGRPAAMLGAGLALTGIVVVLVFAAYAGLAGLDGVHGLVEAMASLPLERRVFFLVMGAKVAFVEETLFRGHLCKAIETRGGTVVAVVASSVVFALFHRTLSPVPLLMKLVFGLLFATAAVRTRSLWPSAIAHTGMWAIIADN